MMTMGPSLVPARCRLLPALALAALLSAAGCVENDQSVIITGNFALDSACAPPATSGIQRPRGRFDIGLASLLNIGYVMVPRVQNQLPTSVGAGGATTGPLPVEMNNLQLVGFEVDVVPDPDQPISAQLPAGVPGLTSLAIPYGGGVLAPSSGTFTGTVEVIGAGLASMLLNSGAVTPGPSTASSPYQTLTVRVRAKAIRSGTVLFSNWMELPVEVCAFCLAEKPGEPGVSGYNPATKSLLKCPDATLIEESSLAVSCLPQQDTTTSCCLGERQIVCGKQVPHKKATTM